MRRRATIRRLDVDTITSQMTNGVATEVLVQRNLGSVYLAATITSSQTADNISGIFSLQGNGIVLTLPAVAGQTVGRWLRITAPGTSCSVAAASGELIDGAGATTSLDISQGSCEIVVVPGPSYHVISRYVA